MVSYTIISSYHGNHWSRAHVVNEGREESSVLQVEVVLVQEVLRGLQQGNKETQRQSPTLLALILRTHSFTLQTFFRPRTSYQCGLVTCDQKSDVPLKSFLCILVIYLGYSIFYYNFRLMQKTDFTCSGNHPVPLHFTYNNSYKPLQWKGLYNYFLFNLNLYCLSIFLHLPYSDLPSAVTEFSQCVV